MKNVITPMSQIIDPSKCNNFCFSCLSNNDEVNMFERKHFVNEYVFLKKAKCKFFMCTNCEPDYIKMYGNNFCPWCPHTLEKIGYFSTQPELSIGDFEESPIFFFEDYDILREHPIIKRVNPNCLAVFQDMTKLQLIGFFIFSMWFAFTVMLPLFFVLYVCVLFRITSKFICQFISVAITVYLNYLILFLVFNVIEFVTSNVRNMLKVFIFGNHLMCY